MSARWAAAERSQALARAEREGVDVLVVGGGITGAGVLRDAASRGLRALLVERDDFASGTSSRSSKMLHGGLRYIGEGHLGITYRSCRERDRFLELNPCLARRTPFLFPAYRDGSIPPWQLRTALFLYRALSGFRESARYRILSEREVFAFCPDLRREGLLAAGLYTDAQVDDARLVIESLKSARSLGAEALNHVEARELQLGEDQRIRAVGLSDRLTGRHVWVRTRAVVNAAGPWVGRVRALDPTSSQRESIRPAKGVHLVLRGGRVRARGTVTFEARDGRHLFLSPWEGVLLLGTTDDFTREIDEPRTTEEEVSYLLEAANHAFPGVELSRDDVTGVFAGVRPLVADEEAEKPPSSVSREHRISTDPSGLVSVAGGKLTLYRAMGEWVVDRVVRRLPPDRRRRLGPSRTWTLPLRRDDFDPGVLEGELHRRFALAPALAEALVRRWGAEVTERLEAAPEAWRTPMGGAPYLLAEVAWSFREECPASLSDLLERRLRLAIVSPDQGLGDLDRIAEVAASTAGWDGERLRAETAAYRRIVALRYRLPLSGTRGDAQSAA